MPSSAHEEVRGAIVRQLAANAVKAAFVAELRLLAPSGADQDAAFEQSLDALERDGRVLVRAHSCGDPHMRLIDLRIASLIETGPAGSATAGSATGDGGDQINQAVRRDQALWDEWITDFLRNHRCAG